MKPNSILLHSNELQVNRLLILQIKNKKLGIYQLIDMKMKMKIKILIVFLQ